MRNGSGSREADTDEGREGTPKQRASRVAEATPAPKPERQFVDIDPWAVLLEGLMEIPEEKPAERKPAKGK